MKRKKWQNLVVDSKCRVLNSYPLRENWVWWQKLVIKLYQNSNLMIYTTHTLYTFIYFSRYIIFSFDSCGEYTSIFQDCFTGTVACKLALPNSSKPQQGTNWLCNYSAYTQKIIGQWVSVTGNNITLSMVFCSIRQTPKRIDRTRRSCQWQLSDVSPLTGRAM